MEQALAQRNRSVSLKPGKSRAALTITHPNAAGVDIGNTAHFVAVPPDRDDEPVREFPSFTVDTSRTFLGASLTCWTASGSSSS
jgi:transposase